MLTPYVIELNLKLKLLKQNKDDKMRDSLVNTIVINLQTIKNGFE